MTLKSKGVLGLYLAVICQLFANCDNPETPSATLDDLSIRFLDGYIEANLMPVVPQDPIVCQIAFLVQNGNPTEALIGLSITQAEVYLDSTNQRLGTINFLTAWDGRIGPIEQDTVRLTKVISQTTLFPPPCMRKVYFNLVVKDQGNNSKTFKTESLLFSCVY
jgi:hypothetical protein